MQAARTADLTLHFDPCEKVKLVLTSRLQCPVRQKGDIGYMADNN